MADLETIWLRFAESCEHYHGVKFDDAEDQCTHPGMSSYGSSSTWCEQRRCPRADAVGVEVGCDCRSPDACRASGRCITHGVNANGGGDGN